MSLLVKSTHLESLIKDIKQNFPEFLRPVDIVKTGLYKSRSDLCWSMKRKQAPPSIRLSSHKIIFPRASLCDWLVEKAIADSVEGQNDKT